MMTKLYQCDICDEKTERSDLLGCQFRDNFNFRLSDPQLTDGKHICTRCAKTLKTELAKLDL